MARVVEKWDEPCVRSRFGAHDFEPVTTAPNEKRYYKNELVFAICRKCGVIR